MTRSLSEAGWRDPRSPKTSGSTATEYLFWNVRPALKTGCEGNKCTPGESRPRDASAYTMSSWPLVEIKPGGGRHGLAAAPSSIGTFRRRLRTEWVPSTSTIPRCRKLFWVWRREPGLRFGAVQQSSQSSLAALLRYGYGITAQQPLCKGAS